MADAEKAVCLLLFIIYKLLLLQVPTNVGAWQRHRLRMNYGEVGGGTGASLSAPSPCLQQLGAAEAQRPALPGGWSSARELLLILPFSP